MSKKTRFEIATEEETLAAQRAEQQPTWTPEYPGQLPPREMSPDEIERAEAEKAALLSTLPVEPRVPWRKPVETGVAPVVVTEPIEPPAPGALDAAKAKVIELQDEYRFASETAELAHKAKLAEALKELGALEQQTFVAIDAEASGKLREAVSSMQESKAGEAVLAARADAGTARQEALRKRAAHALGIAAQTRAVLKQFDKKFGAELERLTQMTRDQFLLGVPNAGRQAERAISLYGEIQRALENIQALRDSLEGMLKTDTARVHDGEVVAGFEREIQRLVEVVKTSWSPEDERNFVWCVTRLASANSDSVSTLQLLVRGIIGRVMQLKAMQQAVNTEPIQFEKNLPEPGPKGFTGLDVGEGWAGLTGGR